MRYLFYTSSAIHKVAIGILSDEAEKLSREGNEVFFAICGGATDICAANTRSNKGICKVCKFWSSVDAGLLNKSINIIRVQDYMPKNHIERCFNYQIADELRQLEYKHARIGLGVLSSYIDITRNHKPLISVESKRYFDHCLSKECDLTDAFYSMLDDIKPDTIYLYNGRFMEYRPLFDIAIHLNIPLVAMEVIPGRNEGEFYKVITNNCLPQDIRAWAKSAEEAWTNSTKSPEERKKIAISFYENRRNKKPSGDRIYIKDQQKGKLPSGWDNSKRNIAIFNSSEDEYAALGGDFDELPLFPNQKEALKYIFESFKDNDDYHFYLRVHPNLSKVKYKYHTDLLSFDKEYKNVTVIPGSDNVDTYAIMDSSEKVIVFNSTMGIESVYWGKPVILLNPSFYYFADVAHIPSTPTELLKLIQSDLKPKFNDYVYKYGYYIMDLEAATIDKNKFSYLDFTLFKFSIGKFKAWGANYQTLLGSNKLLLLVVSTMRVILSSIYKDKFTVPLDEE